jgi:type IV pilus assembly protein PilE
MMASPSENTRGFTVIELVVVIAILGILITLAVPSYTGARRNALVSEADSMLSELKTMAWLYYQQYGTWAGLTDANFAGAIGFRTPPDAAACWDYGLAADATATQIQFQATGDNTPPKCTPVNGATITLTLRGDGSSLRDQVLP